MLRDIFGDFFDGILIVKNKIIIYANKSFLNIVLKSYDDVVGKKIEEILQISMEKIENNNYYFIENSKKQIKEVTISKNYSEKFESTIFVVRDEAYNFGFQALYSISDNVIIINSKGEITFINRKCKKFIAKKLKDVLYKNINDVLIIKNKLTKERYYFDIEKVINSKNSFGLPANSVLVTKDEEKYISMNMSSILLKNNRSKDIVIIFKDITKIRETELRLKKYMSAIEYNANIVVITDENFNIEYANKNFYKSYRRKPKECINRNLKIFLREFFGSIDKNILCDEIKKHGKLVKEIPCIKMDGKLVWEIVSVSMIEYEMVEDKNFVFIIQDISKIKEQEKLINVEREHLETIFKSIPQGMIVIDEKNTIIKMNNSVTQIFDIKMKDFLNKNINLSVNNFSYGLKECSYKNSSIFSFLTPSVHYVLKTEDAILNEEYSYDIEINSKKYIKWIRYSAILIKDKSKKEVLIVVEDITEKILLEDSLIKNEERLRLITNNMSDIITQVDFNGTIIYASPSHEDMLGYKSHEVIGKNMFDFIYKKDIAKVKKMFIVRKKSEKSSFTSEFRIVKKNKDLLWVESSGTIIRGESDEISTIVYVSRDISMKIKARKEIIKAKEIAIAANNAKSQFLANMSHEIRTPMNGIIGMTDLTLMTDLTDEQRENLMMVKSSSISLLNLINSILDLSKIESGKIEIENLKFNILSLFSNIVKIYEVQAKNKGIDFYYDIDSNIKTFVVGDSNKLRQIIVNLLSNAIKFTFKGFVKLELKLVDEGEEFQKIMFKVLDTGIGISKKNHDIIFKSFVQADGTITRRFGGTGLGLTISRELVELLGGKLEFKSKENVGSEFYFDLTFDIKGEENIESISFKNHLVSNLKVLLVEDDRINQKLAEKILKRYDNTVIIANNGLEALEILKVQNFDVILMDIQMPEMDGIAATKVIREKYKLKTPIIALTAHAIEGDRERFISSGMDEYISKPIDIKIFYEILEKVVTLKKVEKSLISFLESNVESSITLKEYRLKFEPYVNLLEKNIETVQFEEIERTAHYINNLAMNYNLRRIKNDVLKIKLYSRKKDINNIRLYYSKMIHEFKNCFESEEDYENFNSRG